MSRKHIILNNDSVLLESHSLIKRVTDSWLEKLVHRYTPRSKLHLEGINYSDVATETIVDRLVDEFALSKKAITRDYNLPTDLDAATGMAKLINLDIVQRFQSELTTIPGATQALKQIRTNFGQENVALATANDTERMNTALLYARDHATGKIAGLAEAFPVGVLRNNRGRFDNHYTGAFQSLTWDPKDTIVVEHSASGVEKALHRRPQLAVIGTVAAQYYVAKHDQALTLIDKGARMVILELSDLAAAATWVKNGMIPSARPDFNAAIVLPPKSLYDRVPGTLNSSYAASPK